MTSAATPEDQHLLTERRGHVLIVTMNRPEARNALSGPMMRGMEAAWDLVDSDPDIRACILTGAGGFFCAGADLKAMNKDAPGDKFAGGGWDLTRLPALLKGRRLSKPLIAAVEGPAIAGGTEILQGTDIRVAGRSAKFGVSALEIADLIAANGPLAVRGMIETIRRTEGMHEEEAFTVDAEVGGRVFASADAKEGPRAFAEKRTPEFRGE